METDPFSTDADEADPFGADTTEDDPFGSDDEPSDNPFDNAEDPFSGGLTLVAHPKGKSHQYSSRTPHQCRR